MGEEISIKEKNVEATGSISRYVVENLIDKINFAKAKVIVKYGLDKEVITIQLLTLMKEDAILFVFETNKQLVNTLSGINNKHFVIVNEDVGIAKRILRDRYKIETVDYIISTMNLKKFDKRKKRRIILNSHDLLKEKGKFITTQFSWLDYFLIKERFSKSSIKLTLLNIPPVFMIEGIK